MSSLLLKGSSFTARVSSVLNRDVKSFGKNHIFDGKDDTCWNSDEGTPQWVALTFSEPHPITGFKIQFQGGFVGKDCLVELTRPDSGEIHSEPFYPEDVNNMQTFLLSKELESAIIKFLFRKSTDFFGRVVIYSLDVLGS